MINFTLVSWGPKPYGFQPLARLNISGETQLALAVRVHSEVAEYKRGVKLIEYCQFIRILRAFLFISSLLTLVSMVKCRKDAIKSR
jgi:hypothetical protein